MHLITGEGCSRRVNHRRSAHSGAAASARKPLSEGIFLFLLLPSWTKIWQKNHSSRRGKQIGMNTPLCLEYHINFESSSDLSISYRSHRK